MVESVVESSTQAVLNVARTERIRVLHVDDDQAFLKVAKQCLDTQGEFEVDTASSVNEALEKSKKTDYDAIVSDYQMPGKDGLEFLKELRGKGNTVPFIVFTGKGREEVAIKALNLGADQYIDKHGDSETVYCELAHAIRQATDRKSKDIELFEKEARLQAVLESSPDAITVSDLNGNVIQCNKATLDLLGFSSKDELIGKNGYELIAEKDRQKATENLKKTLDQGSVRNTEYAFLARDGHEFPAELSASVLRDSSGKVVGFVSVAKDISERKKAEEALLKSEKKYRLFVQNPQGIAYRGDTGFNADFFNGPVKEITGYSEEELLKGKLRWDKLIHEEDSAGILNCVKESISNKQKSGRMEYRIVRKDGRVKWIRQMFNHLFDDSGEVTGSQGILYDITEEKKAEEEIKILARFPSENPNPVLRVSQEGIVLYANNPGKALLQDWEHEVADRDPSFLREAVVETLDNQSAKSFDLKVGKQVYSIALNPVMGSGYANIYGIDITERRKAEEEVKSSEQKFRGLVEDSAAAIATIDLKGRLTYVNRALADSLGYSVQEMPGRAFKDFVHPDDRGKLVRLFLKIIVLRRKPRKFEFRALRKDGGILHLTSRPTRLETAGKTVGFQAIIMDSTAEKRMLEKAEKTSEKLSVVGGLTRHDVNNKLSTILNVSYLLKQKLRDNQSLELVKETESAVHQIEGLFEFARTYEKLGTEELAYVDAEKVFNEAARLFPSLKDIRIVNDCHGLTLFADSLLRQLFYNLIDNSLKHGEKVGQVRVHYEISEDHLKLIYDDDGVGIPKAEKDKIFKEGYGKARGHGLYLIKKMCEVYGWAIQETGRQGKGAKFVVTMPETNLNGKESYVVGR